MVDDLFVNPFITAPRAQSILGVTAPTARNVIAVLETAGILREVTGRPWGRRYAAEPILEILLEEDSFAI
jgi:Fic family protein